MEPRPLTTPLKVLVADSYADGADSLALLLKLWGYDCVVARTGLEALAVTRDFRPDVALIELVLPGLDGYRLCRHLREQGTVVFATATYATPQHRRRCRDEGFERVFLKPLDPSELEDALRNFAAAVSR